MKSKQIYLAAALFAAKLGTSQVLNTCTSINYVTKTNTATGNLSCSKFFDDGVRMGIAAPTTPFTHFLQIGGGIGSTHVLPTNQKLQSILIKFPANGGDPNYDRSLLEMHSPDGSTRTVFQTLTRGSYIANIDGQSILMQTTGGKISIGSSFDGIIKVPTEQLHTDGGVRFEGLTTAAQSMVVGIDANGKLFRTAMPSSGITNACGTTNYMPKTSTGGNLICSQIFDDGTSVGIGTNTGFAYTWPGGLTGTTPPPASGNVKLYINGVSKALAYFATSDQKFKKDITKIVNALDIIKKLEGKTYFWRANEFREKGFNTVKQYGFIAQEIEKVVPEAVAIDQNGDRSVNYDMIIPILVQGTKEQLVVIDNLQKQVDELKNLVQAILTNSGNTSTSSQAVNLSDKNVIVLNQNVPNPFSESTIITYNIPTDFNKALLNIHTIDGKLIRTIEITTKGQNTLNVFANDLSSGIYSYTLIIDGKVIETKRMIKQ